MIEELEKRLQGYTDRVYPKFDVKGKEIYASDSKMRVVIPTLLREQKQKAVYQFPEELYDVLYLATKEERVSELKKYNPGFKVLELPNDTKGIAQTRQRCIELLPQGKVWMMDDIIKLQKRSPDYRVLGKASPEEVLELYDFVSKSLDYHVQVGVSDRPGNNRVEDWRKYNQRSYTNYGLRTDILSQEGIRFDGMFQKDNDVIFYEDFYLTLSLLTKGYSNIILYDWVSSHSGHQAKGGNSVYRNNERQKYSAEALCREFPDFVKLVQKEGSWGKGMETRWDVSVRWKKAFESSVDPLKKGVLF